MVHSHVHIARLLTTHAAFSVFQTRSPKYARFFGLFIINDLRSTSRPATRTPYPPRAPLETKSLQESPDG